MLLASFYINYKKVFELAVTGENTIFLLKILMSVKNYGVSIIFLRLLTT